MKSKIIVLVILMVPLLSCKHEPIPPMTANNFWTVNGITYQGNTAHFYANSSTNNQLVCGQIPYQNDSSKSSGIWIYFYTPFGIITAGQYPVVRWLPASLPDSSNECAIYVLNQSYYGDTALYSDGSLASVVTLSVIDGKKKAVVSNASLYAAGINTNVPYTVSASISE